MTSSLQTALQVSVIGIALFLIIQVFVWGTTAILARMKPALPKAHLDRRIVTAPVTGTVLSIAIHAGDTVGIGQELCVIEAPQIKTAVRAGRMGTIETIRVAAGDAVLPGQPLMDFSD